MTLVLTFIIANWKSHVYLRYECGSHGQVWWSSYQRWWVLLTTALWRRETVSVFWQVGNFLPCQRSEACACNIERKWPQDHPVASQRPMAHSSVLSIIHPHNSGLHLLPWSVRNIFFFFPAVLYNLEGSFSPCWFQISSACWCVQREKMDIFLDCSVLLLPTSYFLVRRSSLPSSWRC